jgi:hypothetical protein
MIKIVLQDDVYVTSNTHVVDTKIHIIHNDYCFPSDTRTDFTFPILEEWKNNLINARYSNNISFRLFLMMDPFG